MKLFISDRTFFNVKKFSELNDFYVIRYNLRMFNIKKYQILYGLYFEQK